MARDNRWARSWTFVLEDGVLRARAARDFEIPDPPSFSMGGCGARLEPA